MNETFERYTPPNMTEERIARWWLIERLWAVGAPIKEIVARTGKSHHLVTRDMHLMRANGWDLPLRLPHGGTGLKRRVRWYLIRDMWEDGYNVRAIAAESGMSMSSIYCDMSVMRAHGWYLEYRNPGKRYAVAA